MVLPWGLFEDFVLSCFLFSEEFDDEGAADGEDDEYDSMDDDDGVHNWPDRAYHNETFFGYVYEAGEHVLREFLHFVLGAMPATKLTC